LLRHLNPDEHLIVEDGRVFRWSAAGAEMIEPGVRRYFESRLEDDDPVLSPRRAAPIGEI
jgi:hypothetical protein